MRIIVILIAVLVSWPVAAQYLDTNRPNPYGQQRDTGWTRDIMQDIDRIDRRYQQEFREQRERERQEQFRQNLEMELRMLREQRR